MKILTHIVLIAFLLVPVSACRADEGFKNIRYDVKSYQWWPVVALVDIKNKTGGGYHNNGYPLLRNSGYNEWLSTSPVRDIQPLDGNPSTLLKFKVTWYEVVTKRIYNVEIDIDSKSLKPDPIRSNEGLLILRIARGGDIQIVTYSGDYPRQETKLVFLQAFCGSLVNNVPSDVLNKINKILDQPLAQEAISNPATPSEIPSSCE